MASPSFSVNKRAVSQISPQDKPASRSASLNTIDTPLYKLFACVKAPLGRVDFTTVAFRLRRR